MDDETADIMTIDSNTQATEDTFFVSSIFNEKVFEDVSRWILRENRLNRFKELNLVINSPGGSIPACLGIIDMMDGSRIPINTIGLGEIASCAFMTFINGKKRTLTPNTMCLSHDFSQIGFIYAKYHELVSSRKMEDFAENRIRALYKKNCRKKISDKTITDKLLGTTDRWLYPQEVKDLGFCDEIKFLN